jgi:hypothetical protein
MTTTSLPLYRLLMKLGANEAEAESAAALDASMLATKSDIAELKTLIAAMEAGIAWKIVGAMVSLTGIFAVIVAWLVKR